MTASAAPAARTIRSKLFACFACRSFADEGPAWFFMQSDSVAFHVITDHDSFYFLGGCANSCQIRSVVTASLRVFSAAANDARGSLRSVRSPRSPFNEQVARSVVGPPGRNTGRSGRLTCTSPPQPLRQAQDSKDRELRALPIASIFGRPASSAISCRYVSASRDGTGRSRWRRSGAGTHRLMQANDSELQTGHVWVSWISWQSRQRRAT
jgi:hypothetical protein